jgi:site-specific recombinase XerD
MSAELLPPEATYQDLLIVPTEPGSRLPADRHPVLVYLARLSVGSRRTQRQVLEVIAEMLAPGIGAEHLPWGQLRYSHVQAVRSLLAERYSPATANKALTALRGVLRQSFLLGHLPAEEYQRAQCVESIRGTRLPRGRSLTAGEIRSLFGVCDTTTPGGSRNACLLGILYGGGLRRMEAAGLTLEQYDTSNGSLKVLGKGNKQRLVPLPPGAQNAVSVWLSFRGPEPGPLLCPVLKSGQIVYRHVTGQAILEILLRLTRENGGARFSPHDLRRTFVGDLLDAGADLALVQGIVGHSSPATTARYDRRPENAKRRAADMIHVPFSARSNE